MPSGIKIAKFIGGMIEVCFLVSFVYEVGKEAGRKEQMEEDAQNRSDNDLSMNDLISMLKNVDKSAVDKARGIKKG